MKIIFLEKSKEKSSSPLKKEEHSELLSYELWKKKQSYKFWKNWHRHLFGISSLLEMYYHFDSFNAIQYNSYKTPMLNSDLDFTISHSKNHIVYAIAKNIKIAINYRKAFQ